MILRNIPKSRISALLDEISGYNENERFNRVNLEKYLSSSKKIDSDENSMYCGLFDEGGKCLSLCYLNKVPEGFVLVAEIQCVVHGYGRPLLEAAIRMSKNMWLAANPEGGESLLEYYRGFGLEEISFDGVKWAGGGRETFFFKAATEDDRKRLVAYLGEKTVSIGPFGGLDV